MYKSAECRAFFFAIFKLDLHCDEHRYMVLEMAAEFLVKYLRTGAQGETHQKKVEAPRY